MAARPPGHASAVGAAGRRSHPGWPHGTAGGRHEPGRRPALDPLAGFGDPGIARGWQCLLYGLSVHVASQPGTALATRRMELAALAAEQVVGRGLAGALPLGL